MNIETYIVCKLAEVMNFDELDQRIAIGCAIRNRAEDLGSWWLAVDLYCPTTPKDPREPLFEKTLWAAEEIYYRRQADITDGCNIWSGNPPINKDFHHIGNLYFWRNSGKIS